MLFRTFIEEWWGGELEKRWGEMHFNGHINSQGQAESDQEGHPARVKEKGQQKIRRKVRAALHLR